MSKKLLLFFIIVLYGCFCRSQKIEKNEIFYIEGLKGLVVVDKINSSEATTTGGSLNWEFNRNLLSFRYHNLDFEKIDGDGELISFTQPNVSERTEVSIHEVSFLFGRRLIMKNWSFSGSAGVSYNFEAMDYRKEVSHSAENSITTNSSNQMYFGIPYELNLMVRTPKKMFLTGEGAYWAAHLSFKLFGNISKHNYTGIGIAFGFGRYKYYSQPVE